LSGRTAADPLDLPLRLLLSRGPAEFTLTADLVRGACAPVAQFQKLVAESSMRSLARENL